MSFDELFLLGLSAGIALLFAWAFRALPGENWQILACLPGRKGADGFWEGTNLTYYGFFNALACVFAVAIFLAILGSAGIPLPAAVAVILPLLAVGMWAARFIARLVEKKPHTSSVGAASFACIIVAPWIIYLVNETAGGRLGFHLPVIETIAAMVIAYAFGEGIGRLACISFGCCYGKPLEECHPVLQTIFRRKNFIFRGRTKKISYAGRMEGRAVVPVQALTAVLYTGVGILSFYLLFKGFSVTALILSMLATQNWRFVSEFLRADYRGGGHVSTYQIMSLLAEAYMILMVLVFMEPFRVSLNLRTGLQSLWHPGLIIFLVVLWIVSFLYAGKSEVTCCTIDVRIMEKEI